MIKLLKDYSCKSILLTAIASGIYPFFHFYSSNLKLVGSIDQHLFLLGACFLLPIGLMVLSFFSFKTKKFLKAKKYVLTAINLMIFFGLLSVLVFHYEKKPVFLVLLISGLSSLWLYKYLDKIIILQFLLAAMSVFTLVPKLFFAINYENSWTVLEDNILQTKLKYTPNIYVIQPDGYVNIEQMDKAPYNFDNKKFYNWLTEDAFVNYTNFRSNYYSTLTSNSSMFAMRHHYYSNTYKNGLKTFYANKVIVGTQNNVLSILKNNDYNTNLLTDNSYFLIDRIPLEYDFCNIPMDKVLKYDTGSVPEININENLEEQLKKFKPNSNNFFFIEKTIPSHIHYRESNSLGVHGERKEYLDNVLLANIWVQELIETINKYDPDPLIVIVADHGGFVGLNFTLEAVNRKLNTEEIISGFSSMLSVKWPKNINANELEFKTNVNLFRNVFSVLADDPNLLKYKEKNNSYIPLKEEGKVFFYQCIDEEYNAVYKLIDDD